MEPDFRPQLIALWEGWLDGSVEIFDVGTGICDNVYSTIQIPCGKYNCHFKAWDKFSGSYTFPVPSTNKKYSPEEQFYRASNLWFGKQGKLRRDLLRHLIKCLKAEMEGGNV